MQAVPIPTPTFSGHETFPLRYGWLKKAVDAVNNDRAVFSNEDALVSLGVGKNMVRSIRHWGLATRVLEEDKSHRGLFKPSRLGDLLFGKDGWDPYVEDPATLWLLHWGLASKVDCPTTWYWAFNICSDLEFTRDRLTASLQDFVQKNEWKRVADNSLRRDVDCFIRTYVHSRATKAKVLEDSLESPLAELGLIREIEAGRLFEFVKDDHPSLPVEIFAYALDDYWTTAGEHRQTLNFEDIAYAPGSPGRVFRLTESALTDQLEALAEVTEQALSFDTTAGLRQMYRRDKIDAPELLLKSHYELTGVGV